MLQRPWRYRYPFGTVILFPSGRYPEAELLDHMVVLFLIFWGTSILFSTVTVPIYIPTNSAHSFPFLHILTNNCYFFSFFVCVFVCVYWGTVDEQYYVSFRCTTQWFTIFIFLVFLIIAILIGVRWYLVVLICISQIGRASCRERV